MPANQQSTVYGQVQTPYIKKGVESKTKEYIGLAYPFGVDVSAGGFFSSEVNTKLLKSHLKQALLTQRGERVMLPNFGANLRRHLFQPLDEDLFEAIKEDILLTIQEPNIKHVKIKKLKVIALDEVGTAGTQALKVTLTVWVEDLNKIFDVEVKIG